MVVGPPAVIVGTGTKFTLLKLPVPVVVVTDMPFEAPAGTTALILVDEFITNDDVAKPPKLTDVVPSKCDPVIVTLVPAVTVEGLTEVITGAGAVITLKVPGT